MQQSRAEKHAPERTTTVLPEHTTTDGQTHFDWLIERPNDPAEHRMITFRCAHDPLTISTPDTGENAWAGERLPDHRTHYIRYEGPISGNRGNVRRIWSHPCRITHIDDNRIEGTVLTPAKTLVFTLKRQHGQTWKLTISASQADPDFG